MNNEQWQISKPKLLANIIILIIALFGLSKRDFTQSNISLYEELIIETFAPVQEGSTMVKEKIGSFFDTYIAIINTNKENVKLRKLIKDLQQEIFNLGELDKENKRLKSLLKFGEEIPMEKVLAQIIGRNASSYFKVLRINKGYADGIKVKAPVVTSEGLVGYVQRTSKNFSDILTILDPLNRVDAIVSRSRTHGIIEGYKNFSCRMKHVVRTEPLQKGDIITSAGLGHIYPKGLKIGSITRIEKESYGITQFVVLKPSVDFHKLEEVVVLLKDNRSDKNKENQEKK